MTRRSSACLSHIPPHHDSPDDVQLCHCWLTRWTFLFSSFFILWRNSSTQWPCNWHTQLPQQVKNFLLNSCMSLCPTSRVHLPQTSAPATWLICWHSSRGAKHKSDQTLFYVICAIIISSWKKGAGVRLVDEWRSRTPKQRPLSEYQMCNNIHMIGHTYRLHGIMHGHSNIMLGN